jgi:predicted metal-binding protein
MIYFVMGKFHYIHRTGSGRSYPLEIGWASSDINAIPVDKNLTENACRVGCRLYGRNGGCPPFSPDFKLLRSKFKLANIIYAKILIEDYPPNVLAGNYYVRWSFIEALLTPFTNKFAKIISDHKEGLFLSSGFCRGCGNQRCVVKDASKCRHPLRRTFSLESTGVIVSKVAEEFLGFELYWWDRANKDYYPPYMIKIVSILSNQAINNSDISALLTCSRNGPISGPNFTI